jgi:NitT/TauT family transport system substrate-binding protein
MRIHAFKRTALRAVAGPLLLAVALVSLAACGATADAGTGASLPSVTIGLTYVPNVQFAPFYVAKSLGYYQQAGVNVTLRHHTFAEDEFGALVAGKENLIIAGGDETLQARSHGVPLVYVAEIFTSYPVTLIVPADSPIHTLADLRGHTIGVPGAYGATYIGLLALLQSAGLSRSDVTIQSIGYTQVPALLSHKVDAVMGYSNNEPIQFQKAGFAIRTFPVSGVSPLISNGLVVLQSELNAHPDVVRKVIAATLKGVEYTLAHPQQALDISKKYVPDLQDPAKAADAMAVLQATLPAWQTGARPGAVDPQAWQAMATFLQAQGQLAGPVDASKAFTNAYLP